MIQPHFKAGSRLGNNLFQFAAALAYARREGVPFGVPWRSCGHAAAEELGRALDYPFEVDAVLPVCWEEGPLWLSDGKPRVIPHGLRHGALLGEYQSPLYFSDCEQELREVLAPLVAEPEPGRCGLHLRLGDFLSARWRTHLRHIDPRQIPGLLNHAFPFDDLVVFSEFPAEARGWMERAGVSSVLYSIDPSVDAVSALRNMTACDKFICSTSTLSWWAAWLGKHSYVSLPYPFTKKPRCKQGDLYLHGWHKWLETEGEPEFQSI